MEKEGERIEGTLRISVRKERKKEKRIRHTHIPRQNERKETTK